MIGLVFAVATAPPQVTLKAGLVLNKSVRIRPGVYRIGHRDETGRKGAITIRGNNLTLDFKGVTLEGTAQTVDPNRRQGTGIYVEGKNITIKNLRVRGYKLGLVARNAPGLKILESDFSYNWKQRLLSGLDREDGADWMSYHRNEKDEWLRYGAGIYLRKCDGFEVRGTTIRGGQCGLMLMECNRGKVWNNDFSFLSAVGLGMYLSSDNRVMHNKIDWCVRGYSHGVYNRGQDSTGILIYEQSNRNVFAYNSATHGGDGFFLWAGQTTMDTGKGGCNDNLLYANDLSHSPANAIEATFSRNQFVHNLLVDNWHGVWGGYSFDTPIIANVFGFNGESIAIEHGQNNRIEGNWFRDDTVGVYLWQNANAPDPNWGYPKFRDTRNRGTVVKDNLFERITETAIHLGSGFDIEVEDNRVEAAATELRFDGTQSGTIVSGNRFSGVEMPLGVGGVIWSRNRWAGRSAPRMRQLVARGGGPIASQDGTTDEYRERYQNLGWKPFADPRAVAVAGRRLTPDEEMFAKAAPFYVAPMKGGQDPFLDPKASRGRRYILVDEWGPYDFQSPKIWPRGERVLSVDEAGRIPESARTVQTFEVLGPRGSAKILQAKGLEIVGSESGTVSVPGTLEARLTGGGNVSLILEYRGGRTVDVRGIVTPAGKPVRFSYSKFFLPIAWEVKWFHWNDDTDPRTKPDSFAALIAGNPVKVEKTNRLDFPGNVPGVSPDRFATVADGTFEVDPGVYVIEVTTDDGARVWLDGKPLIEDAWIYQGPTLYTREVKLGGKHRLRVEHFEIDGYSALKVNIRRK